MSEAEAASAVKKVIEDHHAQAWELAQQYALDQRPMTLAKIKELKEAADLLSWAVEGRGKTAFIGRVSFAGR